jgi:hypothetical protein
MGWKIPLEWSLLRPALPANIRLGRRCLTGTNTPTYFVKDLMVTVKVFIAWALVVCPIDFFQQ